MFKKSYLFLAVLCCIQNQLQAAQHIITRTYPNTYEGLIEAASDGNVAEIRRLVQEEGINVDPDEAERDADNETALMAAAENGQVAAITELVNLGADVDFHDVYGTALMQAALNGQVDAITELVRLGADLEGRSNAGFTAVMRAATALATPPAEKISAIKELVRLGANIDARASEGDTALMNAAENGAIEIIAELIRLGANIDEQNNNGNTALNYAVDAEQPQTVIALLNLGAHPNAEFWEKAKQNPAVMEAIAKYNRESEQAIHEQTSQALQEGGLRDVAGLISGYAAEPIEDPEDVARNRAMREMQEASIPGLENIINDYVAQQEEKEKEEKQTHAGATPIVKAIPSWELEEQRRLGNLLLSAIKRGSPVEDINQLLNQGAQLGFKDSKGYTPLMMAVLYNKPMIVDALLERISKQYDPDYYLTMKNKDAEGMAGLTALEWAETRKNDTLAKKLRDAAKNF